MKRKMHLFLLKLDDQRYALRVSGVARVVRMVEITPMPNAPAAVLGLVNVQGEVLPVLDLRECLGHTPRAVEPQDVLVIVSEGERKAALAADAVAGVVDFPPESLVGEEKMLRHPEYLEGVVKLPDGLVLVCDLEKLFTLGCQCAAMKPEVSAAGEAPRAEPSQSDEGWSERRELLRLRAAKLAREVVAEDADQSHEIVEFLLSGEHYGIESAFIREVYPLKELTPLPCTPSYVLGIVNMRGKILSVIDMRKFFELPEQGLSDLNKVIVLHGADMEFGVLADAIVGVRTVRGKELQPSLPTLTEVRGEYLKGVTRERLVVLDAAKLLSDRRIVVHEEA